MVKQVDTRDLKSLAARRAGSTPAPGTILKHIRTQAWALRVALIEISCETSRERFESASVFQYGRWSLLKVGTQNTRS